MSRPDARSWWCRARCATRRRCSSGSPTRRPGEPYLAPARARPYTEEVGADPGQLRVGLMTNAARRPVRARTPSASRPPRRRRGCSSRSGTRWRSPTRTRSTTSDYIPQLPGRAGAAGVDWNLRYWAASTGQRDRRRTTWSRSPGRWPRWAARTTRGAVPAAPSSYAQIGHAQGGRVVGRRLRPAAHADAGAAAAPARLDRQRPDAENPLMPIVTRHALRRCSRPGFNATGQPAISLPLHMSVDGPADRRAAGGRLGREDLLLRVASQLEERPGEAAAASRRRAAAPAARSPRRMGTAADLLSWEPSPNAANRSSPLLLAKARPRYAPRSVAPGRRPAVAPGALEQAGPQPRADARRRRPGGGAVSRRNCSIAAAIAAASSGEAAPCAPRCAGAPDAAFRCGSRAG